MLEVKPGLVILFLFVGMSLSGCVRPDLETRRQEAYRLYQKQQYAAAAQEFEVLVKYIPQDAELWFRLGNAYTRSMQPKRAINAYENAILRDPRLAQAWYNKGIVHVQQGLKTFVDMPEYVDSDDPVTCRGIHKRDQLLKVLAPSAED
ncbi:MAG: tetratricopeptide repeat protein [Thermodesulfobacteriota bacterium]|nr:tetratricopeptide repeat protein [Thermodesulfobacteriota bacterium]